MADTIPGISWRLRSASSQLELASGFLPLSPYQKFESRVEKRCTALLQEQFPITQPLWFGIWMVGWLTVPQATALKSAFEISRDIRSVRGATDFLAALSGAVSGESELHVELNPLGHMDFGIYTIYAHCPRCKFTPDLPPWEPEAPPKEPMDCKVCGYSFIPADTYSSEWKLGRAVCDGCGFKILGKELNNEEYQLLSKWESYQTFATEAEQYDTPEELEMRATGMLMYSLTRRPWVYQRVQELKQELADHYVLCPSCKTGHLFLPVPVNVPPESLLTPLFRRFPKQLATLFTFGDRLCDRLPFISFFWFLVCWAMHQKKK